MIITKQGNKILAENVVVLGNQCSNTQGIEVPNAEGIEVSNTVPVGMRVLNTSI